jgi:peptide/nickel transport system substrate-binding protein
VFAIVVQACTSDTRESASGGTVVLSQITEPRSLDPAISGSIVSFQVTFQIFETLVTTKPGGLDLVPALARSWTTDDGQTWTFKLERGVRFHDGTTFDARSVCANFGRWHNFTGLMQQFSMSWRTLLGGYAKPEAPGREIGLYRSCEARADDEVVIGLTQPFGGFLSVLATPAFAMASPDALQRYGADRAEGTPDSLAFDSDFSKRHPIGTGPFRLDTWELGERLVLVRNDDYWGEKAKLERVIFRPLGAGAPTRQALESGEIDGYNPVDPADIEPLRRAGFQLSEPASFSVAFLAMNQGLPPLDNPKIRQAVAHALNRDEIVKAFYQPSAVVAHQFTPPSLWGHAPDVPQYPFDVARARRLIAESGVVDPTLELWVPLSPPTGPGFPSPKAIAEALAADLERAGFKVVSKPAPDPEINQAIGRGQAQLYLNQENGFRADPDTFLNRFQRRSVALGLDNGTLFGLLDQAERVPGQAERTQLYERANRLVMELLPAVPLVHVRPVNALAPRVKGNPGSPVPWERLALYSVS